MAETKTEPKKREAPRIIQEVRHECDQIFERWGDSQWCIGLTAGGEIYLAADELRIDNGHLLCVVRE